ncbi:MAG: OmpA family protein [Candidatus Zixiibacteriota bacterium]|nr:MAG: OmpA family protein [candidate division Zixibacteria bacterium]
MRNLLIFALLLSLAFMGCGASKGYVAEQIAASEAKTGAEIASVSDKTDTNAAELARLQSLAAQIEEKADLAINKAKGFENYQIIWQGVINFDFDSYLITAEAEQFLTEAGEKMEEYPGSIIEMAGHTDRTGPAKYNHLLGQQRADAAKRFLTSRFGISLYRMFTVSFGEDKPIAMPDEQNASSTNRRVALTIWGEL